ncbi:MAG TPA: L-threonylcarbamoyladenylate synthase, partial [Candidatus Baltobacteraceae bacterium]|nr:L-threonylcarbamoyladenylate synthase [Candidatus Baltobacteraceae bacterium]
AGGTIIFPNETSYGIACDPYRSESVDRVYRSKRRPDHRPLTLHVATPAEFLEHAPGNALAILAAKRLLPGPVILIVRKPAYVSDEVTAGMATLGFRVPGEPLAQAILERCGPLAVTSANTSSEPPYRGSTHVELPEADLLIENGPTRYEGEASIVDLSGTPPRMLREGLMSFDHVAQRLGPLERPTVKVRTK